MLTPAEAIDRLRAPFKPPPGYRSAHAKGAFYEGTFVATPQAAELCRAEHFGGTEVPVLVRWSNAAGTPRDPDSKPDIHGMALKFRPGAGDTDLLGQTSPRFPTDDPEVFVDMVEPSVQPWKLPLFLARHPGTVPSVVAGLRHGVKAPVSYAEVSYYPIHAYGWLDAKGDRTWVRYVFRPVATVADRLPQKFSGPDRLREEILARLARGPVAYDVHVQVAGAGDDPHSTSSVWTDPRDFVAGRLTVTGPVSDPEADGSVVVFDPTRVIDGIELSDDPVLRFRGQVYGESVARRQGEEHARERATGA